MNALRKILRFLRKLNYADVTEFKDGFAFAIPSSTLYYGLQTVVIIDENYKVVKWTDYRTFDEAKKNS